MDDALVRGVCSSYKLTSHFYREQITNVIFDAHTHYFWFSYWFVRVTDLIHSNWGISDQLDVQSEYTGSEIKARIQFDTRLRIRAWYSTRYSYDRRQVVIANSRTQRPKTEEESDAKAVVHLPEFIEYSFSSSILINLEHKMRFRWKQNTFTYLWLGLS